MGPPDTPTVFGGGLFLKGGGGVALREGTPLNPLADTGIGYWGETIGKHIVTIWNLWRPKVHSDGGGVNPCPCPPSPSALRHAGNAWRLSLIKGVVRLGHPHFLDAVLYAGNAPNSISAVGSRSDSAFHFSRQFALCYFPAPFRSYVPLSGYNSVALGGWLW